MRHGSLTKDANQTKHRQLLVGGRKAAQKQGKGCKRFRIRTEDRNQLKGTMAGKKGGGDIQPE